MDDEFSGNNLIQVSNEDSKKDIRYRIDTLSFCDFIEFNLVFIFSILTVSLITIFAFHHYGVGQNSIYLDKDSDFKLIKISPINIIPFSGFYRIYIQAVQNKKNETKENLQIDMKIIETFLNGREKISNNLIYNPTIYFNGNSTISTPLTLFSSHSTPNASISIDLTTKFDKNINKILINWEFGSKSTVFFSFILKFLFFIISIIILFLILWSQYYSNSFIHGKNFQITVIFWISLFLNSFFYSYQIDSLIYFLFSFLTTITFKILSKLIIIYFISSVRMNRNSDNKMIEDHFVNFGYIFFSLFEGISVFLTSISFFNHDQLSSEIFGMKIEFYSNFLFIIFVVTEFIQSKKLIENQEKINLFAFFSLSLIFITEKVIVKYLAAIKNFYFCKQAFNNIDYTASSLFVIILLMYNWPVDEEYEIYYQQDLEIEGGLLQ